MPHVSNNTLISIWLYRKYQNYSKRDIEFFNTHIVLKFRILVFGRPYIKPQPVFGVFAVDMDYEAFFADVRFPVQALWEKTAA